MSWIKYADWYGGPYDRTIGAVRYSFLGRVGSKPMPKEIITRGDGSKWEVYCDGPTSCDLRVLQVRPVPKPLREAFQVFSASGLLVHHGSTLEEAQIFLRLNPHNAPMEIVHMREVRDVE